MSQVEVGGAGWSWMELGGDRWNWVEVGEWFSNTLFKLVLLKTLKNSQFF